jgi:hypothetical protein
MRGDLYPLRSDGHKKWSLSLATTDPGAPWLTFPES